MTQATPGYGLAVTALIIGIVSIPLVSACGLGVLTAILGFVLAVGAHRVAGRAPAGARGLATAAIVVNGVVLALAAVALGFLGVGVLGSLWTQTPLARRASIVATQGPAATPSPRATGGTVLPTTAPLARTAALGESAKVGTLTLASLAYSEARTCPGGSGRPAEAAKFVVVQARARNDGTEAVEFPQIYWTLETYRAEQGSRFDTYESGRGSSCRYNDRAFGNACRASGGRLFPGAQCEGWLLFQVPAGLAVELTTIRAHVSPAERGLAGTVTWRMQQ